MKTDTKTGPERGMLRIPEQAGTMFSDIRYASVNGVTVAYKEAYPFGLPLLLINGFASPMDTWNPPVLAALARHFRVIVFDNRGTGYSTASIEPFSIPLFAKDAVVLMDALGIARANVLGLSMGASIAQELVLAHPDRVERLVLVAGTCGGIELVRMRPETWERLTDNSGTAVELADRMFSVLFTKNWLAHMTRGSTAPTCMRRPALRMQPGRRRRSFYGRARTTGCRRSGARRSL